jgi:magnesium transporter
MGEFLRGLEPERAAALLAEGRFFWADVPVHERTRDELHDVLGIPDHALRPLLEFDPEGRPSRKFHVDGDHVVFVFSCFVASEAVEVHVLVSGDFVLTVHESPVSLPDVLEIEPPRGRSEQYLIYVVLEGMLGTLFDKLSDVDDRMEELMESAVDLRRARVRNQTLREITSHLSRMRRHVAPLRGTFARVSHEIGRVEGVESDSERYFDEVGDQINRLVDAIDAAASSVASLIDLRLNETIYWLTVIATVFLPLTFITGFFGMNFGWMVSHIDSPWAFLLLGVGGCALGVAITLLAVRRRTPVEPEQRPRRTGGRRP